MPLDLLISARRLSADEALRMGLVNAVFPGEEFSARVMDYARDVAKFVSPRSAAVIKRQVYSSMFEPLFGLDRNEQSGNEVEFRERGFPRRRCALRREARTCIHRPLKAPT